MTTAITEGVLYLSKEVPHIIGHLVINGHHYELVGVKRNDVRADVTLREIAPSQSVADDSRSQNSER